MLRWRASIQVATPSDRTACAMPWEALLAADIATPEHDPYAPAQYIGLYDPFERTCNIFARFEPGAESEKE
jgi:hypothetical protein